MKLLTCSLQLLFILLMLLPSCQGFDAPTDTRFMWITPLQISSLIGGSKNVVATNHLEQTSSQQLVTPSFFLDFAFLLKSHFDALIKNDTLVAQYRAKYDLHVDASSNDIFYFYQVETFPKMMQHSKFGSCEVESTRFKELRKMYTKLIEIFSDAIAHYIQSIGVTLEESFDPSGLFIWSSIHANGTHHQAHHHDGSSITGVVYIQVPSSKCGSLVFEDPRGSHPPFGKTHRHEPVVGDLLIFPSWLVHRIEPTLSATPRISVSFNYRGGSWLSTSDLNKGFRSA